ncbi:MAG: thioesterase family protein [Burkholderiaceae bacterium]
MSRRTVPAPRQGEGATAKPAPAFEPEFIAGLKNLWEEMIAFNKVLGLRISAVSPERVSARIMMRRELIGHYSYDRIHGGVISAGLDGMGGLAVMAAIGARHMDEPPALRLQRFSKLSTIDLRVDYLRPGIGEYFDMHAQVMRLGSRVASTRMEFCGVDGKLLSTGAAAYMLT